MRRFFSFIFIFFLLSSDIIAWGFFAHKRINRLAVFSLPPEMIGFFKSNIQFITENAVNPDRRRYAVKGEAEKHFLDADIYGDSAVYTLPRYWNQAVEKFGEEELRKHGIGPWNAYNTKNQLTEAFKRKDQKAILRLAADLGHYIGDINVPLHTTRNYNGQLTNQYGIHAFWESRIPELLSDDFDFFVGQAEYLPNTQLAAWDAIIGAHLALDSVLNFEKILTQRFAEDKKYSFEERGGINTKVYSREFTTAYNEMLSGQVERQMKRSIKMIADFWYSAWIDAGQPDLNTLLKNPVEGLEEKFQSPSAPLNIREHEGVSYNESPEDLRKSFYRAMWRTGN
ncbi:zinc dependent phospholipase C family protein [Belliella marina]|uniref:Zinc dependent phospholipase C family protein n=1 Tax=Belliella marina TaxID=1644146 RepID=A0ABW4VSR9_9BACT